MEKNKKKKMIMASLILGIVIFIVQPIFSDVVVVHPKKKALTLNGSFSIAPAYTWIDNPENATSLYEGWENKLNIFIMGRTPKTNITGGGIFICPYKEDKKNKVEMESIYLNLTTDKYGLTFGNSINNVSDMSVSSLRLRGIRLETSLLNSQIEVFGGRSNKADETTRIYDQYNAGIRIHKKITPSYTLGITFLSSSDDKGSISDTGITPPLDNSVVGADLNYSPYKNSDLTLEYLTSWYDANKLDNEKFKKDDAYKIQAKGIFKNVHLMASHKRIGSAYYTAGNSYLLADYQGMELKAKYPFKEIYLLETGYENYKDNLDGSDVLTKKTEVLDLKFEADPLRLPRLTLGYQQRSVSSNEATGGTGKKKYDDQRKTILLGLTGKQKILNWNLNIDKTYLTDDSKYTSGYQPPDREFLTSSLSLSSQLLKNRLDLMANLSDRIFENKTTDKKKEETFYSILRLRYKLVPQKLNLSTHYNYTANVDSDIKPKEIEMGLGLDYYLSTRQSFYLAYKDKRNREENKYHANTVEVKYTRVF